MKLKMFKHVFKHDHSCGRLTHREESNNKRMLKSTSIDSARYDEIKPDPVTSTHNEEFCYYLRILFSKNLNLLNASDPVVEIIIPCFTQSNWEQLFPLNASLPLGWKRKISESGGDAITIRDNFDKATWLLGEDWWSKFEEKHDNSCNRCLDVRKGLRIRYRRSTGDLKIIGRYHRYNKTGKLLW